MRVLIAISLILSFSLKLCGQKTQLISHGTRPDSSFYTIEKIDDNEYWVGGEFGILKRIDTLGNMSSLGLPNQGRDIIKILKVEDYVYILTADAVIYRYDRVKKTFLTKEFSKYKKKCFYDIIALQDGKLLVCGGATGIAEGKPRIPKGFIAKLDPDLKDLKVVWQSIRKFVWSLLEREDQTIMAVTFNGLNTRILESIDLNKWKKTTRVKGLVHEINCLDDQIWYSGARSILFKKSGILGILNKHFTKTKKTGCLWRLDKYNEDIIGVTYSGELLSVDKHSKQTKPINVPRYFALYDVEQITTSKILVVGRGKTAYIVDVK